MKQKRQIGVLFILIMAAAMVWAWNFHDKRVVTADASPNLQDPPPLIDVRNPHIRMEDIDRTRKAEYKGTGRNPFSPQAAPVSPKTPLSQKPRDFTGPKDQPPPPPPPPPTLPPNVKFYGFGGFNGTARRAFFTDGEEVYLVGEGDVFLKRFRITRIGNANLEFEEIGTGRFGTAPLEEQAAPGQPQ